jgi:hypothetical protein
MNSFIGGLRLDGAACLPVGTVICGVKSQGCLRGALGSNDAYEEFRRLTIRGVHRSRVCTQRSLALACRTSCHQRLRRLGCCGGKSPRAGLLPREELYVRGERQISIVLT